ncbi:glycosyltransferase family 76 protein [Rickenella mellea]|uniref:GPI mannosyltransferase 2 n=1 Tax=Rickenella mellea TaxID=50990 RepID=A0A4Y7QBD8_9AGAM|nr:glycosyltransferase family 76 protein [Rickenella mellea]
MEPDVSLIQKHKTILRNVSLTLRLLIAVTLYFTTYLPQFDSSPEIILRSEPWRPVISTWASTLLRWDAFHFLHIAKEGYVYEYEWAFLPGAPYISNLLSLPIDLLDMMLGKPHKPFRLEELLVMGALASLSCDGVFLIYRLTGKLFDSPSFAMLTAILSLLSSSPATLRHAGYTEPFFAFWSYYGMVQCVDKQWLRASLGFAVAGAFRSNGVFLGGFLIWGMLVDPILLRQKAKLSIIIQCAILSIIPSTPFIYHQYCAYKSFCGTIFSPPWCNNFPPSNYSYVQSKYWNVGFLRYWTVSQIPNFIISTPVLVLLLYSSTYHIYYSLLPRLRSRISPATTTPPSLHQKSISPLLSPQITPHAIYALILTLMLLFAAHTQIILRLAAAIPFTYWSAAHLWLEHPRCAKAWTAWSVVWGAVSLVLWGTFLPPA